MLQVNGTALVGMRVEIGSVQGLTMSDGTFTYLPELDIANAKQIDPTKDTAVTTAAIPGVSILVAAGTLLNQQGTVFTGKLSVTEVPANLTPAALPKRWHP